MNSTDTPTYPDWLEAYKEYTGHTETPDVFNYWTGLSVLSTSLQKKVWMNAGRLTIHPNLYIVLTGPPGARKSQAVKYGKSLLSELENLRFNPSKCTTELLIHRISKSTQISRISEEDVAHTSYSIISEEFETFLGVRHTNDSMINFLTDIFDCGSPDFEYITLSRGSDKLVNPFINLLACTTPTSLSNSLPLGAVGGGLTSRIIFPTAKYKSNLIAYPKDMSDMKDVLVRDLEIIHRRSGEIKMSPACKEQWRVFYEETPINHDPKERLCTSPLFNYWYERKFLFLQKLAILFAVSESSELVEWGHFERAITALTEVEGGMDYAFSGVGESPLARKIGLVKEYVEERGWVTERELLVTLWKDMTDKDLDEVIDTLEGMGVVVHKGKTETAFSAGQKDKRYVIMSDRLKDWEKVVMGKEEKDA